MECSFKYSHWKEILVEASRLGYALTSFKNYDPSMKQVIILRHDVDYSANVEAMARTEHECGATATYFLRMHSSYYNPLSYRNYKAFKELLTMGHEIGLHFDGIPFIGSFGENLASVFKKDKELLETMFNIEIVSASVHAFWTLPVPDYFGFNAGELGIENYAYAAKFTKDMKYISDSRGGWQEGCLCKLLGKYPKIQCLTHPYWWYEKREDAYDRW